MKILHTSDWHLGHVLYGYDRTAEQTGMLAQIEKIVTEEQPDAFLLSGDVYHTSQPSAAVSSLFSKTITAIHKLLPEMAVVITAGNHDSASRHETFQTPWKELNVHTIGSIEKDDNLQADRHIITIPGKGRIIAVPYCNERSLPEEFFKSLQEKVPDDGLPVVMMAHLTVRGCDFKGHDNANEYVVGGIDSIDLDELGDGYDYLALGHIHHAQFIGGSDGKARYSGSPMAVSFDENYPHSVSVVEIGRHGDSPSVREIEIMNPKPLKTLPEDGFASWEDALDMLKAFPDDDPSYVRMNVEVDDFLPVTANAEAQTVMDGKAGSFCLINTRRKPKDHDDDIPAMTVHEFRQKTPAEIAERFCKDYGIPFDDELKEMFREAEQRVKEDNRNK